MSKCRRCGRQLKQEPWRSKGIGKICEAKLNIETAKRDSGDSDVIIPYDGGDIWIERLAAPTYDDHGNLTVKKHTCSGIKTNVQRTVYRHSPTGFNFGYGGSGPADLALNICMMFTDKETAETVYQDFKWKFCCGGSEDKLVIPKQEIIDFIAQAKEKIPAPMF